MILESRTLGEVLVALIGGAFVWLGGQKSGKAEFITAVNTAAGVVIDKLTAECNRVTSRCEALERQHEACEAELASGRKERAELWSRINELMSGGVAIYAPGGAVTSRDGER